ncbi:hypothetical protein C1H46_023913 [Malus baccata]|uniref:B-like cyclin n=1 Tax=Malus baccata TaxID=106549 RepID=A0A540LVF0_MALBA|nr:hypothetical protein C1H46_023913 [Malus baccata]
MLYLQCKEGKRMGKKQSCFFSRQFGGDWHHAAMPSLVSWVVVRRVGTWKPPHAFQYNLHNDKREKHKDNLFEVQRLLHLITRQMLKPFWNASTIADYIMEIEFLWEKDIKVALWGGNTTSLIFSAFEFWLVVKHTKKVFKQQWLSLTFSTATIEAVMAKAVSQWYFPYHKTQFSILKAQVKSSSFSPRYRAYHQPYINKKMRAILIDWLIKVHYKFELMGETQFLNVNLIDRFFESQMVIRKQLQLVGVTTMLLACKYEVSVPIVVDFVMKEFDSVFEQLKICMVTLYTHLPTSCNSLREVNDRVKALGHLMSATILSPWKAILLEYGFTYVIIELDRFILSRSAMDFDFANMMLFEVRKGPIEMFLREFSSLKQDKPAKPRRHIPQTSEQTLDAPHLIDDYYPNLLVWGSCNNLVIALASTIYLWEATNLSALSRIKALDWLGHVDEIVNGPDYKVEFLISDDRLGPPTISLSDATFGYPSGSVLFRNFNCGIALDSRITMVGPNGIGQSTILQLIAGELQPISLTVFHSATVQIALSVSTALRALQPRYMLSGGQRSRDAFAKITTMKLHIILLGEPSNHRDLDVVEALIQGLVLVQGGILTVSNGKHLVSGSMDYKKIPLLQSSWEKSYQPFIHHSDFGNIAIELKTCPFTSVLLQVLMFHNWWSYVSSLAPKVEPSTTLLVSTEEDLVQKVSPQAVLIQQNSHIPSKNNKFTLRLQDSLVNFTANSSRFQVLILTLRTRLFFKGRAML